MSVPVIHALLGAGIQQPLKRTPLGILYQSNGFDKPKPKKIEKGVKWLRRRNIPEQVIEEFVAFASSLNAESVPRILDEAFDFIYRLWTTDGPPFIQTARKVQPSSIIVTIEQQAFWLPGHEMFATGVAELDKKNIRIVVCHMRNVNEPKHAQLARLDALAKWEIGNLFALRHGYIPNAISKEVGFARPSEFIK